MSKKVYIEHNSSELKNKFSKFFCLMSKGLSQAIENYIVCLNELVNESGGNNRYVEVVFLEPMTTSEKERFINYGVGDIVGSYNILKSAPNLNEYSYVDISKQINEKSSVQMDILKELGILSSNSASVLNGGAKVGGGFIP